MENTRRANGTFTQFFLTATSEQLRSFVDHFVSTALISWSNNQYSIFHREIDLIENKTRQKIDTKISVENYDGNRPCNPRL